MEKNFLQVILDHFVWSVHHEILTQHKRHLPFTNVKKKKKCKIHDVTQTLIMTNTTFNLKRSVLPPSVLQKAVMAELQYEDI